MDYYSRSNFFSYSCKSTSIKYKVYVHIVNTFEDDKINQLRLGQSIFLIVVYSLLVLKTVRVSEDSVYLLYHNRDKYCYISFYNNTIYLCYFYAISVHILDQNANS